MRIEASGPSNGEFMKQRDKSTAQVNASTIVETERKRREAALDKALENTFPASDPVSVEQPEGELEVGGKRAPI
jgi:hypothetical protein